MKNKYYIIKDKKNEIYINAFVAIDDNIAIQTQKNAIKQAIYIKKNTKNLTEQAQIINYLSNAANYELIDSNELPLLDFGKLIKELEKK